jgi:uncharacterized SAM-binding protein YcdF (DUF218 family)
METHQAWKDQEHDQISDDVAMERTGLWTKSTSNRIGRRMKILIGFAFLCLLLVLFRDKWLLGIGDFLIVEDTLQPADVIHVIAGDDYRLDYAIQLYRQGYGKKIFLTGGGWCLHHQVNHSAEWKERALGQGVLEEDIIIDDGKITSTYNEAEWLKIWIEQSHVPIRSVIVVSDPFHMRRARWAYQRVLGDSIEIQMAPVPFDKTPYQRVWWQDHRSRLMVGEEYEKIVYYLVRYQFSRGFVREWLASLDQE